MSIQTVKFHDQTIQVLQHEGKPYVAIKSIVENIGLDWSSQHKRINRNRVLSQGVVMMTTPSKGGAQEVVALPLGMLNGWLFGIDINRVRPEIQEALYLYQLECFDILYQHFLPKVAEAFPNTITVEQQHDIKRLVNEVSRRTGRPYQFIYTRMYDQFKVPRYQELKASDYSKVIEFLAEMIGQDLDLFKDETKEHQIFAVTLMKLGLKRYFEHDQAYRKLQSKVAELGDELKDVSREIDALNNSTGAIYDGLAESQFYLQLDKGISKAAHEKALAMHKPLVAIG